jgi:outer membrane lipoprotein carrier protein
LQEQSTGILAMQAPRLFRWEFAKPYEQLIVADGDHVWVYDIDLEQVSVRPQSFDESHSPLAVLMDLKQIDSEFKVTDNQGKSGVASLRLTPKSKEADFAYADLSFSSNLLRVMNIVDNFGGRTEIAFSGWQTNVKIDPKQFHFKPPKGVDVVGEMKSAAEVTPIKN